MRLHCHSNHCNFTLYKALLIPADFILITAQGGGHGDWMFVVFACPASQGPWYLGRPQKYDGKRSPPLYQLGFSRGTEPIEYVKL
jgi:hypothetical protein